jgi:pimeloyl-ACP methyl ester carboxylesterase
MFLIPRAVAATGLFAAILLLGASAPRAFDAAPYLHPQQLVDIGGRRLNLYCTGHGSPTVVLDTDGDDTTLTWRYVQPVVAQHTRVCSYDSAGLGFSDPAPGPRDASAFVSDLHTLLLRAHVPGPYVIAGYGVSGLYDRLYADRYPAEVSGMVLLDPTVVGRNGRVAALAPALKEMADMAPFIAYLQSCRNGAQHHALKPGSKLFDACMWPTGPRDPMLPADVRATLIRQWENPLAWQDMILVAQADKADDSEIRHAQRRYGSIPIIVLSPDVSIDLKQLPIPKTQAEKVIRAYPEWEAHIAHFSSDGAAFVVKGSSHAITEDRPAAAISAIDEVVDQVRYGRPKPATTKTPL